MNLKKPLSIQIFYLTEEMAQLTKLGVVEHEDAEVELRDFTFYHIDHIAYYEPLVNNQVATRIISGGMDYLTNMSYNGLKRLIEEHI